MSHLAFVALVVRDYDAAIRFFVDVLQFELAEDIPSLTNDGRPKRWVVVRPTGGQTGLLLPRRRLRCLLSENDRRGCAVRLAAPG